MPRAPDETDVLFYVLRRKRALARAALLFERVWPALWPPFAIAAGFVILATTLSIVPSIPIAGMALILGIDRFMSECRALTNFIGNGVATIAISRWENEVTPETLRKNLRNPPPAESHPAPATPGGGGEM